MFSKKQFHFETPRDLLLLATLMVWSSGAYALLGRSDYLAAMGWFAAGVFFYLRSHQLTPIANQMVRIIFWVIGLGILVALWLPFIPQLRF